MLNKQTATTTELKDQLIDELEDWIKDSTKSICGLAEQRNEAIREVAKLNGQIIKIKQEVWKPWHAPLQINYRIFGAPWWFTKLPYDLKRWHMARNKPYFYWYTPWFSVAKGIYTR